MVRNLIRIVKAPLLKRFMVNNSSQLFAFISTRDYFNFSTVFFISCSLNRLWNKLIIVLSKIWKCKLRESEKRQKFGTNKGWKSQEGDKLNMTFHQEIRESYSKIFGDGERLPKWFCCGLKMRKVLCVNKGRKIPTTLKINS